MEVRKVCEREVSDGDAMEALSAAAEIERLRLRVLELEAAAGGGSVHAARRLGGDAAFSTTVFSMGTEVSVVVVSTVMLAIIVLTVAIERVVHLAHGMPEAYQPLVVKLEEEFMIMGAVSFLLVIVEISAGISHDMLLNMRQS